MCRSQKCPSQRELTVNRLSQSSEFTQQDGKTLECDKRDGPIASFVGNSLFQFNSHCCLKLFYKKICLKECEVWRKDFSSKIIFTLVTQDLPSSFVTRPVA